MSIALSREVTINDRAINHAATGDRDHIIIFPLAASTDIDDNPQGGKLHFTETDNSESIGEIVIPKEFTESAESIAHYLLYNYTSHRPAPASTDKSLYAEMQYGKLAADCLGKLHVRSRDIAKDNINRATHENTTTALEGLIGAIANDFKANNYTDYTLVAVASELMGNRDKELVVKNFSGLTLSEKEKLVNLGTNIGIHGTAEEVVDHLFEVIPGKDSMQDSKRILQAS